MALTAAFDKTLLNPQEQQVGLLTESALNGCRHCKTVHTGLGRMAEVDLETLEATVAMEPLPDAKLDALQNFTHQVVEQKGRGDKAEVQASLDAAYHRAQVFEVVMGVAMKPVTNYANHLAGAEPNAEFIAMVNGNATASL